MAKKRTGITRIGTSNIVVPGNKQSFPEAFRNKTRLTYYSSLFNTVELNSTFYKTPMTTTFEKWQEEVPADFQFSIKLSKDITHAKDLKVNLEKVDAFMAAASRLTTARGCLLIQFPGKITFDYFSQVEAIFERLTVMDTRNRWRMAVEFRHASWYCAETFELLDEHHAALVLHDIPKGKNLVTTKKADFVYIRYHGPENGNYRGSYSDAFLKTEAVRIRQWQKEGKDVYVYFNNTIGSAFENARLLVDKLTG